MFRFFLEKERYELIGDGILPSTSFLLLVPTKYFMGREEKEFQFKTFDSFQVNFASHAPDDP